MGLFKKKFQCVRCGIRQEDNNLIGVDGVLVCPDCMDVVEKIKTIAECFSVARAVASSLTSNDIYLSDFNPAGNSVMVLDGIENIISAFYANSELETQPQLCRSFQYNGCRFIQVCKEGKL